ncbi:MAG: nucleoside deaminase [Desulfobacteraceae bacterium]|jgi:tRNA(adenine34) deaminase
MNHDFYMKQALEQAELALFDGEFPVGCVIVHKGNVVVRSRRTNSANQNMNEIDHAEIIALKHLSGIVPPSERKDVVLYSTMEPCLMCFAAIMLSGIRHVVYSYEDAMGGGTACNPQTLPPLYSSAEMTMVKGIMRKESLDLFKRFFLLPHNRYWKGSYLEQYTLDSI